MDFHRLKQEAEFDWDAMDAEGADDDEEEEEIADGDGMDEDEDAIPEEDETLGRVYLPGQQLEEGEELVCDPTAYVVQAEFAPEWPCLSIDVIQDNLGAPRSEVPMTVYFAAGTQAARPGDNKITVMKVSNIRNDDVGDSEDEDEDDDDEGPELKHQSISHRGGVNRIRFSPHPGHIAATWADTGKVHIWDLAQHVAAIDEPAARAKLPNKALYTFDGHANEGFALDWSPVAPYKLASGDCSANIHIWEKHAGGSWLPSAKPLMGHTDSVEDIQWSPSEANVLASSSVDKTVKIWDLRNFRAAFSLNAHDSDVNVVSWNRLEQHLLASGGDDGVFKIWDLRAVAGSAGLPVEPVASFKWHSGPIVSIQWHPSDPSVLCVAGADDQISLWDLAVEMELGNDEMEASAGVPPQLLFIHQGQNNIKDARWHPQIPGMVLSTAESGFNIFKTISV